MLRKRLYKKIYQVKSKSNNVVLYKTDSKDDMESYISIIDIKTGGEYKPDQVYRYSFETRRKK